MSFSTQREVHNYAYNTPTLSHDQYFNDFQENRPKRDIGNTATDLFSND